MAKRINERAEALTISGRDRSLTFNDEWLIL